MDRQFEQHHHLDTVQSHQSFHPVQPTLIIERFLTVAHLPGTPLDLPTHHDTLNLIEELHPLRYRMREGIQHADLFLPMFLFDIHAVIRPSDVIERDEEYEKDDANDIFVDSKSLN